MADYKVVISSLDDLASAERLRDFYKLQKKKKHPIYYLLPSVKWLNAARKRQPQMAFKTFDDVAELILRKSNASYLSVSESERMLFFQQLVSGDNKGEKEDLYKGKAYAQTYGQLKRLGLKIDDLPKSLLNIKPILKEYEDKWVEDKGLLDPENRIHKAVSLSEKEQLPISHVVIDGYMDFSPLQYLLLRCLYSQGIPVTVFIPDVKDAKIIDETIKNLMDIGFSKRDEASSYYLNPKVSVKKAASTEEEIRGVLAEIDAKVKSGADINYIGLLPADDSYMPQIERFCKEYNLPLKITKKASVSHSMLYKTLTLTLRQQSFANKWEKVALVDQLFQLLFYDNQKYWELKKEFMSNGTLPEDVEEKFLRCVSFRQSLSSKVSLVERIGALLSFLDELELSKSWRENLKCGVDTKKGQQIRLEWAVFDALKGLLEDKKESLEGQGLVDLTINHNLFSEWLDELIKSKSIYIQRRPAVGLSLHSFRDTALFEGDTLYVLGMNEGTFPSLHKLGGYFQESDLKELPIPYGMPNSATFRKKDAALFLQLFYKASNLTFSYVSGCDPEHEYLPSPFIEEYCSKQKDQYLSAEKRYNKKEVITNLEAVEQSAYMMGVGKDVKKGAKHLYEHLGFIKRLEKGVEEVEQKWTQGLIKEEIPVTSLERYVSCPFRYGLETLLQVKEPDKKQDKLDPMQTGSMLHRVIERFYKSIDAIGKPFGSLTEEVKLDGEGILMDIFEQEWAKIVNAHYELTDLDLELEKERWQKKLSKWWKAELMMFWNNDKIKDMKLHSLEQPLTIHLEVDSENTVVLTGKVDRLDIDDNGFVIYDYKSSTVRFNFEKDVACGLKLQLPLYMLAIEERLEKTAYGAAYISLKEPHKRATNSVWQSEHAQRGSKFKASSAANKEECLNSDVLFDKYNLTARIGELFEKIRYDYSVTPLKCYGGCPYNIVCRVTDELIEEAEGEWK
ncbi:PD-(D/E)XK nuclease family protein [Proteinivorax tanatarense]|uniref:PD-(D/E)XK nuclease family protein n=1 Tax=Proteinivorax tanatarense TaxID=1260629 RepID=A0AAU7VQX1_9FIRM